MMRRPRFELLLKSLQIANVDVGNSPVVKVRVRPVQKLISLARYCFRSACSIRRRWPNKEVNKVFAPFVDQRRHWSVIQIIQAAANQRKSLTRKIDNRGCKIELGVQPGFYCVLVGGSDVREMVRHKRTRMTGDELSREELIGARSPQSRHQVNGDDCHQNNHPSVLWLLRSSSHFSRPIRAAKYSLSLARARASRDMTVPGGICAISAISL